MDFYHYLQIVILGIVEGVTEFLPISSTGHLLIAEKLLGMKHVSDIFNVVIQAGAILAVVVIYWHKIVDLIKNIDQPKERNYLINVIIAFVTTMVLVLILTVRLKLKLPETLIPVAWATFIGGLVIFGVEAFTKHLYPHDKVSWFEAVLVGIGQVVAAIFPGTSRSGATIMAGMAAGMRRPSITEFTFLVGIPTMFAASAYDIFKNRDDLKHLGSQLIIDTVLGFIISFIVAFFVIKWLLRFVQSHTFNGFAVYRVILGGGLLIGLYTHVISDDVAETKESTTPAPVIAPAVPAPDAAPNAGAPEPITNASGTPVVPATAPTNANGAVSPTEITTNAPPELPALPMDAPAPASTTNTPAPATDAPAPPANVPAN